LDWIIRIIVWRGEGKIEIDALQHFYLFIVITVCTTASASGAWTLSPQCDITHPELALIWQKKNLY